LFSAARDQVSEVAASIHHLSRELHSPTLDLVGLRAAMQSWCNEFGEKRKVEISFMSNGVPNRLPSDVSLHLYRVLQEALHNAAKHSGVQQFEVHLWGTSADILLSVRDAGIGFDVPAALIGRGIGLKSIRERVRLINADLAIESTPESGTAILVRVPIDSGCAQTCDRVS
jgi:signal transduction histidine kinase